MIKATFRFFLAAIGLLMLGGNMHGQAQELNYVMDVYHFHDVDGTPYLEAHFAVHASGLSYTQLAFLLLLLQPPGARIYKSTY